jgi:hypothetical protein
MFPRLSNKTAALPGYKGGSLMPTCLTAIIDALKEDVRGDREPAAAVIVDVADVLPATYQPSRNVSSRVDA